MIETEFSDYFPVYSRRCVSTCTVSSMVNVSMVLDTIIVIAQYARDQAMGSARDQGAKVSLRRVDHYHGEHTPGISLESSKNGKLV